MDKGPEGFERECTDLLCCLVFLAFLVGMVGVSGYGFVYGDPQLFLTMWDADERGCGYSEASKDYPYLYFPIVNISEASKMNASIDSVTSSMKEVLQFGTCVKECPTKTSTVDCLKTNFMTGNPNFAFEDCVYTVTHTMDDPLSDVEGVVITTVLFDFRYDTEPMLGKVCFPVLDPESNDAIM